MKRERRRGRNEGRSIFFGARWSLISFHSLEGQCTGPVGKTRAAADSIWTTQMEWILQEGRKSARGRESINNFKYQKFEGFESSEHSHSYWGRSLAAPRCL